MHSWTTDLRRKNKPSRCGLASGSSQAQLKWFSDPIVTEKFHCPITQPYVNPYCYSSFVPDGTFKPFKLHCRTGKSMSGALYNQSPRNVSKENAQIDSIPSLPATYSGSEFSHDFSTCFPTSTGKMGEHICSSVGTPNNSSSSNLTNGGANGGVTVAEYM